MRGWSQCPWCSGKGTYLEEGDAHRSTGYVPCHKNPPPREGWNYLLNARKFHYFVDGRSLCKRYMLLASPEDMDKSERDSPDDCLKCRAALKKRRSV
jgi:hypothetical protein